MFYVKTKTWNINHYLNKEWIKKWTTQRTYHQNDYLENKYRYDCLEPLNKFWAKNNWKSYKINWDFESNLIWYIC